MPDRSEPPTTGSGVTRYVIAAVVLGAVFVILAVQNDDATPVDLFFWHVNPPLYGVAVVSVLFGAGAAEIIAGLWRHRRHVRNRERLELARLRRGADDAEPPAVDPVATDPYPSEPPA